jgi:hypothetical protein
LNTLPVGIHSVVGKFAGKTGTVQGIVLVAERGNVNAKEAKTRGSLIRGALNSEAKTILNVIALKAVQTHPILCVKF